MPTTWGYDPTAPLWPWVEQFFTLDLLYEYEGLFPDATPRLCSMVGKQLLHELKMNRIGVPSGV